MMPFEAAKGARAPGKPARPAHPAPTIGADGDDASTRLIVKGEGGGFMCAHI